MTEARLAIEPPSLELLVERITKQQLEELRQNIEATEKLLKEASFPNYTQTSFHVLLARAVGNPLLETFLTMLMSIVVDFFGKGEPDMGYSLKNVDEHRNIYEAVARQDSESAKEALKKHILDAHEFIANTNALERS